MEKTIGKLMDKKKEIKSEGEGNLTKRKRVDIDYSVFLKNEGATEKELNRYLERLEMIQDEREEFRRTELGKTESKNVNRSRCDAEVNVGLKSRMMDLRKIVNHPYLVEYPLTEDEEGNTFYRYHRFFIHVSAIQALLDFATI